jgi:hypothetical protein
MTCNCVSVPEDEEASLIFNNRWSIRRYDLNGGNWPGVFSYEIKHSPPLGLEFDHRNRAVCHIEMNFTSAPSGRLTCLDVDSMIVTNRHSQPSLFMMTCK